MVERSPRNRNGSRNLYGVFCWRTERNGSVSDGKHVNVLTWTRGTGCNTEEGIVDSRKAQGWRVRGWQDKTSEVEAKAKVEVEMGFGVEAVGCSWTQLEAAQIEGHQSTPVTHSLTHSGSGSGSSRPSRGLGQQ